MDSQAEKMRDASLFSTTPPPSHSKGDAGSKRKKLQSLGRFGIMNRNNCNQLIIMYKREGMKESLEMIERPVAAFPHWWQEVGPLDPGRHDVSSLSSSRTQKETPREGRGGVWVRR